MNEGPSRKVRERIEAIEGRPIDEAFRIRYVEQMESIIAISRRWQVGNRTVVKLMASCGIMPRTRSDAVKTQWADNDERRRQASEVLRKIALTQSATGRHNRLGKTKETDEGVRRTAEKLKISTSARRPSVRAKMAEAKRAGYAANPSAHPNAKAAPTECEHIMLGALASWGFAAAHNHYVAPYWVDVYIPGIKVGIECFASGRVKHTYWDRHEQLARAGIRMLYVNNRMIKRGDLGDLHQYLADLQVLGPDPASHGQESVIWGCRDFALFSRHPDDVAVKLTALGRSYRLDFSAPSINCIGIA